MRKVEREDLKPEQKVSCDKHVETELLKSQDCEPKTEEGECDPKAKNCNYSKEDDAAKHQIKRDYEAFTEDFKPAFHNNATRSKSPVKKKEKLKGAGDNQPTLFSYFGKR